MRTPHIAAWLATVAGLALAMVAPAAWPAQGQDLAPQLVPGKAYPMTPFQFEDFIGEFDLSNGGTLDVTAHGRRYYAQVDSGAPVEIVATGQHNFASRDGRLRLDFFQYPNGLVTSLTMTMARTR